MSYDRDNCRNGAAARLLDRNEALKAEIARLNRELAEAQRERDEANEVAAICRASYEEAANDLWVAALSRISAVEDALTTARARIAELEREAAERRPDWLKDAIDRTALSSRDENGDAR